MFVCVSVYVKKYEKKGQESVMNEINRQGKETCDEMTDDCRPGNELELKDLRNNVLQLLLLFIIFVFLNCQNFIQK